MDINQWIRSVGVNCWIQTKPQWNRQFPFIPELNENVIRCSSINEVEKRNKRIIALLVNISNVLWNYALKSLSHNNLCGNGNMCIRLMNGNRVPYNSFVMLTFRVKSECVYLLIHPFLDMKLTKWTYWISWNKNRLLCVALMQRTN